MLKKGFWLLLVICFAACDRSKPAQEEAKTIKELPPSRANIEIDFPIREIEAGVNNVLKTELLDAVLPLGKKGDSLFLKIRKNDKLNLVVKGLTAYASIPLQIEVAIKQKILGFKFSNQNSPVVFDGIAKAKTDFDIDSNWNLLLNCSWIGMDISTTPSLKVMGMTIDMEGIVNDQLEKHQDQIANAICNALDQTVDFKSMMTKVWSDLQNPIRIAKNPSALWLTITPDKLGARLVAKNDTIAIKTTLISSFEISPKRPLVAKSDLPNKGLPETGKNYLLAYIDASLPYDEISAIAEKQLGRYPITVQGYQSVVKTVEIGANDKNQIQIDLALEGDYTGGIRVVGRPKLSEDYILTIDNFDFDLRPEGELADAADWMLEEFVGAYIDQYLEFDLSKPIGRLDSLANAGIAKAPLGDKTSFNIKIDAIRPYFLDIQKDKLSWVLTVEGSVDIDLKRGLFGNN